MKLQARTFWIYGDAEMKKYAMPVVMLAVFETVAVILWLTKGNLFYLFNFSYIGISVSLGVFLFIKKYNPFHWASSCLSKNISMPGALFSCLSVCTCLFISD